MMLDFGKLTLRYEPYPIGLARPALAPELYDRLTGDYPPVELFEYKPEIGKKYSLSERNNRRQYEAFVGRHPHWQAFHAFVKSPEFIEQTLSALKERGVDLGLKVSPNRLAKLLRSIGRGSLHTGQPPLSARFEFSMLPADGGSVIPHTDSPGKSITLVISMVRDGEWDQRFGGGLDVNRPKDPRLYYNERNRQAAFEDMEILETFPFLPNQAVVFVKTFNSWHSVRPMTGPADGPMRKTLTINIELKD